MATGVYKEAKTPSSRGKLLDHLRVRKADGGGHVVEHHYADDGMVYHKPSTHVFGQDEGGDLLSHISKHMQVEKADSNMTPEEPEGPEE